MTTTELAERRNLLVQALRSGTYKQGYESLMTVSPAGEEFCCLGVACRIAEEHGVPMTISQQSLSGENAVCIFFNESNGTLPDVVREWYGFTTAEGDYAFTPPPMVEMSTPMTLIRNNDIDRFTFEQIADIIESEPTGLFVAA